MDDAIRIFKNSQVFGQVIMVEILDKTVDHIIDNKPVVKLYNQNQLVGINIFDKSLFSNLDDGFIYPEKDILMELNTYLDKRDIDVNFNYNKEKYLKVAKVLEVKKVKDSDNLSMCKVQVNDLQYSIICGAKNVEEGMLTIAALDNALLSDGTKVMAGQVLGEYSEGMLCSLKELGLDPKGKFNGIVKLDQDEVVGKSFYEVDWRKYNV